jgi:hypothetical protein
VLVDGLEHNLFSLHFLEARLQARLQPAISPAEPAILQLPLPALEVERPLSAYALALPAAEEASPAR